MEEREKSISPCRLCPQRCGAYRYEASGCCGADGSLRLAWAGLHRGEEPLLTQGAGSGALFFSGCTMNCPFCQNYQISQSEDGDPPLGRPISREALADLVESLAERGASNINAVSASPYLSLLKPLWGELRRRGVDLPLLWNSSGYEDPAVLESWGGDVDVWLPDLKTLDRGLAASMLGRPDYPDAAAASLLWMVDRSPLRYNEKGSLVSGVMVRHLVIPGELAATRQVLEWFARHLKGRALLSVMTQYTPVGLSPVIPRRFLSAAEYRLVLRWLDRWGIDDGFVQDLCPGDEWLPDFNRRETFPGGLAETLWHWRD